MDETMLNNCDYNCVKQLSKQLDLLWRFDGYIKDAKECGHEDCRKVFEEIKRDTQRHVDILKKLIVKQVKKGSFD